MNGRMNEREGIATDQGKMDGPLCMKKAKAARHRRLEIRRMRLSRSDGQDLELAKRARRERRACEQDCLLSGSDTGSSEPLVTSSSSEDLEGIIRAGGSVPIGILVAGGGEDVEGMPCRSHGSVSLCGRRREMEDAVTVAPGLVVAGGEARFDFFGVYDGHGGALVAQACRERLHRIVAREVERRSGGGGGEVDWKEVMEACFAEMDGEIVAEETAEAKTIGSTAVVAMVGMGKVVVANCGDSRAVLSRGGVAVQLSRDHKPDRPDEMHRVEAAGGRVINWDGYRVLGVLATSRSIGDHYLKPFVISEPEVVVTHRTKRDEFLILASDGLWDVVPNDMACEVTRRCLYGQSKKKLLEGGGVATRAAEAAAMLAEIAMGRGSKDNISVVVVELRKAYSR
ncbi:hypothetical protein MRB53_030254 [Persea americana]|uniref:Uncharacterized protein n=1 Tax=Persea americana TaxID=3435 RepID=A0ACC2KKN6_PERAE|nr:hypothetical protein MRB53_030254 [Persea americana]